MVAGVKKLVKLICSGGKGEKCQELSHQLRRLLLWSFTLTPFVTVSETKKEKSRINQDYSHGVGVTTHAAFTII